MENKTQGLEYQNVTSKSRELKIIVLIICAIVSKLDISEFRTLCGENDTLSFTETKCNEVDVLHV